MDVFELAALLHKLNVPCHWHIFGSGSLWDQFEARRRLSPFKLEMHGVVLLPSEAFQSIDLLFVPSHEEGFPTVILEARLAGRWVAGWHTTGIPEAAGQDAILVPPSGGLSSMADAICAVLRAGRLPPPVPDGQLEMEQMLQTYDELMQAMAAKT
jgi:glycosyltransferase involved in cell wall biosynthesis